MFNPTKLKAMNRATFSILFFVKWKKQLRNGEVPIYMRLSHNSTSSEFSIKRSIKPEAWDSKKNKAKGNTPEVREINDYLNSIRGQIFNIQKELQESGKAITAKTITNTFQGIGEKQWSLVELFKQHNADMEKLIGVEYAPLTLQRFNAGLKHIEIFCTQYYKDKNLPLSSVDIKFIKEFEFYLKTTAKCQHNSAMKHVKALKKIIRIALANDFIKKDPFFSYKITQKHVGREVLAEHELQAIIDKPIFIERLDTVRDLFLFQCYTGLAYKDLETIKNEHVQFGIDGKKWIIKERGKTGIGFRVPLFPAAMRIIEKYTDHPVCMRDNKLFPVPSNQKMNAYLKELADICGIDKPLHTHIARHTFATTITLANNVPMETVSKLLGHTKIQTTQIYAKVLETKVSDDMERLRAKFA
jgi:site-specific recombinase XerD